MAKGTIVKIEGNSGKIKGDDDKTYNFNKRAMAEGDISQARRGQRVAFNVEGNQASSVRLLNEFAELKPAALPPQPAAPPKPAAPPPQSAPPPKPAAPQQPAKWAKPDATRAQPAKGTPPKTGGKPLASRPDNPTRYHFLNPYNFVRPIQEKRPSSHVLGQCSPPPHDRYVGLTGRLTARVKVVTPVFVSDSHAIVRSAQGKEHATYRFFEYEGQPALPASSLRGMIRSVFETVTQSCFSVFSNFGRLEYRKETQYALGLKAGIVQALPTAREPGKIILCNTAKVGAYYEGPKLNRNILTDQWKCGDLVWARITTGRNARVEQLAKTREEIRFTNDPAQKIVRGYLKITGNNIETKRNETLFLDPAAGNAPIVTLSRTVMDDYNVVLRGQIEEDRLEGSLYQHPILTVGDLVWVEIANSEAVQVVRVRIPRVRYDYPVDSFVPVPLHRCSEYDALCPACRTFGWTYQPLPGEEVEQGKRVAYAGRVRLSHATAIPETIERFEREISLAILGGPKPTKTQFYLLNSRGQPQADVTYNQRQARLRGRKFYRHHGDDPSRHEDGYEYERATDETHDGKDDQNRTVRGAVKAGEFEFSLDFENLAPLELGALLWSLEMEAGMHHRLGYAKPLGFGSVKVEVNSLEVVNWAERLASLEPEAGWHEVLAKKSELVANFKAEMQRLHGASFAQLVAELKAVLTEHPAKLPIHYPRLASEPDPEGKNFKWFQQHKGDVLALAGDDKGLML